MQPQSCKGLVMGRKVREKQQLLRAQDGSDKSSTKPAGKVSSGQAQASLLYIQTWSKTL